MHSFLLSKLPLLLSSSFFFFFVDAIYAGYAVIGRAVLISSGPYVTTYLHFIDAYAVPLRSSHFFSSVVCFESPAELP